jgi:hypothetical protein
MKARHILWLLLPLLCVADDGHITHHRDSFDQTVTVLRNVIYTNNITFVAELICCLIVARRRAVGANFRADFQIGATGKKCIQSNPCYLKMRLLYQGYFKSRRRCKGIAAVKRLAPKA